MNTKSLKIIVASALVLVTAVAYGNPLGSQTFRVAGQPIQIEVNASESEVNGQIFTPKVMAVSKQQAAQLVRLILDVGTMVQPLRLPPNVRLNLAAISQNPYADLISDELNLGVRFGKIDDQGRLRTQNPSVMIAVAAHEFGHLVFKHNLLARFPVMKGISYYHQEGKEIIKVMEQMQAQYFEVQEQMRMHGPNPELVQKMDKLQDEFMQWQDELMKIQMKYQALGQLIDRTDGYNEFFADVVALLYTEKPDSVSDAIHFTEPNSGSKLVKQLKRSEIENRNFKKIGSGPKYVMSDHALFFHVRRMLWDEYLSRPSIMKNRKSEVLLGVSRAILAEMQMILSLKEMPQMSAQVVQSLNQRLAQRIRMELKDLN